MLRMASRQQRSARRVQSPAIACNISCVAQLGALYASLGDIDEAFHWLNIAGAEKRRGWCSCAYIPGLTQFEMIRDTRRW